MGAGWEPGGSRARAGAQQGASGLKPGREPGWSEGGSQGGSQAGAGRDGGNPAGAQTRVKPLKLGQRPRPEKIGAGAPGRARGPGQAHLEQQGKLARRQKCGPRSGVCAARGESCACDHEHVRGVGHATTFSAPTTATWGHNEAIGGPRGRPGWRGRRLGRCVPGHPGPGRPAPGTPASAGTGAGAASGAASRCGTLWAAEPGRPVPGSARPVAARPHRRDQRARGQRQAPCGPRRRRR